MANQIKISDKYFKALEQARMQGTLFEHLDTILAPVETMEQYIEAAQVFEDGMNNIIWGQVVLVGRAEQQHGAGILEHMALEIQRSFETTADRARTYRVFWLGLKKDPHPNVSYSKHVKIARAVEGNVLEKDAAYDLLDTIAAENWTNEMLDEYLRDLGKIITVSNPGSKTQTQLRFTFRAFIPGETDADKWCEEFDKALDAWRDEMKQEVVEADNALKGDEAA